MFWLNHLGVIASTQRVAHDPVNGIFIITALFSLSDLSTALCLCGMPNAAMAKDTIYAALNRGRWYELAQ
jgi:hypothetical protein